MLNIEFNVANFHEYFTLSTFKVRIFLPKLNKFRHHEMSCTIPTSRLLEKSGDMQRVDRCAYLCRAELILR